MKAAAATIVTTPPMATALSGSGFPNETVTDVADDIEWNALRLVDAGDETILISGDFLSIGEQIKEIALKALPHMQRERVLIIASHTHSAPAIDKELPVLGGVDPKVLSYIADRLKLLLKQLLEQPLVDVHWKYGKSNFEGSVYRRRKAWRLTPWPRLKVLMLPNPSIAIPDDLHLMILQQTGSETAMAFMWSYACHPTCLPNKHIISADYPGAIRKALRDKLTADIPVLFLQGFCGDIRPKLFDQKKGLKRQLKRIAYGKSFGPVSEPQWLEWNGELAGAAIRAYEVAKQAPEQAGDISRANSTIIPLSELLEGGEQTRRKLSLYYMSLTQKIDFLAMSCEPVFGYQNYIEKKGKLVLGVGYADHIYGYLPTDKQISEGGYESAGFRRNFSLKGQYKKNIELTVKTAIQKIMH